MLDQTSAAALLGVKEDVLVPFKEMDPYNNNQLEGFLCRQSDHRYGTLVICKVNDIETESQVIYATPKLHYPFSSDDLERRYHWPKFREVRVYEKLDGTNIFAYSYKDSLGNSFTTFKTRLAPILKANKFGDFKGMWDEVLKVYPKLLSCCKIMNEGGFGLSFEMYGLRNPLTIKYNVALDSRLLFLVDTQGLIDIPEACLSSYEVLPVSVAQDVLSSKKDLTEFYNQLREEAKSKNIHNEDETVTGTEGYVFYVFTEDNVWIQFKCKPEDIEAIHWVNDSIPRTSIMTTVLNAVEDFEGDITSSLFKDHVIVLLKEEYSEEQIQKSFDRISIGISDGIQLILFRQRLQEVVKLINLHGDKGFIMRQLSKYYDKKDMAHVYNNMVAMRYLN